MDITISISIGYFLTALLNNNKSMVNVRKPMPARRGIVTKPKYSMNLVVQETPARHGAAASGRML